MSLWRRCRAVDEDGPFFGVRRRVDIQRQAVLGAEGESGVLVGRRGGAGAVPHSEPAGGLLRRCPAAFARGRGTVGDAVPAEQAVFALSAPHRAVLGLAENRDRGEQAVFGFRKSRISREERAGEGRCGGGASFEEAAAGKAMCHSIYLFITIDRL